MEGRKRSYDYDDDGPPKRHQSEDGGHLRRAPRGPPDSRSPSPRGQPTRSRSMSPIPGKGYPRRVSPRGLPRERSFSPGPRNGNGPSPGGPGGDGKICHFWKTYDNCRYGPQCRYAHSMSGEKGRESPSPLLSPGPRRDLPKQYRTSPNGDFPPPGPGGPRRGMGRGRHSPGRGMPRGRPRGSRSPPGRKFPTVCHFWKTNDGCKFGDQCKFLHYFPEGGEGPPPPRRDMGPPPRGRRERSFSPGYARGPRFSPGRGGGESRPIVWRHDVEPRYQEPPRYDRAYSPPRYERGYSPVRRDRSFSPRRYERGMSPPPGRYFSPPRDRGYSPPHARQFSPPPRRLSPRFERGYSPPPPRYDGYPSPPRGGGRGRSFSPPTQYRGQDGPPRGGGPPRGKNELCYFFTQKSGCRYADQCRYIHAKPEAGDRVSPPSRGGSSPEMRD